VGGGGVGGGGGASGEKPREVQLKHIGGGSGVDGRGLSPLEVSMYSLLGVFCVAVVVFGVNCAVFLTRYRRKKGSGGLSGGGGGVLDFKV